MSEKKGLGLTPAYADSDGSREGLKTVKEKYADVTLRLVEEFGATVEALTPQEEKKLMRKLYLHVMLLVCVINLVLFVSISFYSSLLFGNRKY